MPYSLGIETEGGVTEPVISSGSDFSTKILKLSQQIKTEKLLFLLRHLWLLLFYIGHNMTTTLIRYFLACFTKKKIYSHVG